MTSVRKKEPEHVHEEYDLAEAEEAELDESMAQIERGENVDEEYDLTEEEEAELEDRIAAIKRGEWIDGDEVQSELRRRRGLA